MTETTAYRWPDLSPVRRQYIVIDDQGRLGIAHSDPVYHPGVLFAHPIETAAIIESGHGLYMTDTAWYLHDGTYTGFWFDYSGPRDVTGDNLRRLSIVQDLGFVMPDKWAEQILSGLESNQPNDPYMTIAEAEDFAKDAGEPVTGRAIRHAADAGYIPGARKNGRDWLIPYEGFNHYLDNRPKRGRK